MKKRPRSIRDVLRMRNLPLIVTLIGVLGLGGCTSSTTKHAAAASAILSTGNASIENFHSGSNIGIGEVACSFRVYYIDGEFVAKGRVNGVFTLTPGHHVVTIWVEFTHITGVLATRSIDAAQVEIPIDAVAGRRFSISGREFERDTAEIWITDVTNGAEVGEHKAFPVNTTVQPGNRLILIPIPIH